MAWKTLTALTAGVLAGYGAQDLRLENPFGAPELASAYSTAVQEKTVSARFENATLQEVMQWLTKEGANFVIRDEAFAKETKVTLNVKDQPLRAVADAIASAVGGRWERQGEIMVFRSGTGFGDVRWEATPLRGFTDAKLNAEEQKAQQKEMEAFRKEMDAARKEMERAFKENPPKGMTPQQQAELRKHLEEAQKEMQRAFGEARPFGPNSEWLQELRKMQPGEMRAIPLEELRGLPIPPMVLEELQELRMGEGPQRFRVQGGAVINSSSIDRLVKSLSKAQMEKHKKQGHLKVSDLTPEQRRMLSLPTEGNVEIRYRKDGQNITIKNR